MAEISFFFDSFLNKCKITTCLGGKCSQNIEGGST